MKSLTRIIICILALCCCFTGCNAPGKPSQSADSQAADSQTADTVTAEQNQPAKDEKGVKMEDLAWSVGGGIMDGERYVLLEYANNSPYTISFFDISFIEKKDITDEEKEAYFADIQLRYELSDEDMLDFRKEKIAMHADVERLVEPGQQSTNNYCYYYEGYYYVKNEDHYALVEPDFAVIKYIADNRIYSEYYDFTSQKYTYEEDSEVAYYWTTTPLGSKIPKPDTQLVDRGRDDEETFTFEAFGFSLEKFDAYVAELKALGFTVDASSYSGHYSADDASGYNVYLYYDEDDHSMDLTVKAPETVTE